MPDPQTQRPATRPAVHHALPRAARGGGGGGLQDPLEKGATLQSPAWFAEQQAAGRYQNLSPDQFFHEYAAHTLAYRDPGSEKNDYSAYDRRMLDAWGYDNKNIEQVRNDDTGLYAARFNPKLDGEGNRARAEANPLVAFRGTEPTNPNDIRTDLDLEVGRKQYDRNAGDIARLMRGSSGEVDVTGHSLGGALGQIAATDHARNVNALTTFQAPGVGRGRTGRFMEAQRQEVAAGQRPTRVNHHTVNADVVHRAGARKLPGTFHEHLGAGYEEAHTGVMYYQPKLDPSSTQNKLDTTVSVGNQDRTAGRDMLEGGRQIIGGMTAQGWRLGEAAQDLGRGEFRQSAGHLKEALVEPTVQMANGVGHVAIGATGEAVNTVSGGVQNANVLLRGTPQQRARMHQKNLSGQNGALSALGARTGDNVKNFSGDRGRQAQWGSDNIRGRNGPWNKAMAQFGDWVGRKIYGN